MWWGLVLFILVELIIIIASNDDAHRRDGIQKTSNGVKYRATRKKDTINDGTFSSSTRVDDTAVNAYFIKDETYEDLLKRCEWKERRLHILKRDNNICQYCGSGHRLQVHHKYYSKYPNGKRVLPWEYPDDAMITLCDDCHKKIHNNKTIKTYYRSFNNVWYY